MDKYIYDDKNGLWYELQGDYYIPCLILPAEKEQPTGLWGQRHLRYLNNGDRKHQVFLSPFYYICVNSCFFCFIELIEKVTSI